MANEDLTTYTEVDPSADLTVIAASVTFDTIQRQVLAYVRKDGGVGHYTDFEHLAQIFYSMNNDAKCGIIAYSNGENTANGIITTGNAGLVTMWDNARLYLYNRAATDFDGTVALTISTDYWITIKRTGTTGTVKLYSDSSRTVLVDTLSATVDSTAYRYIYALMSWGASDNRDMSGVTSNLDLQENTSSGSDFSPNYKDSQFIT